MRSDISIATPDYETGADVTLDAVVQNLDPGDPQIKKLIGEAVELRLTASATPELLNVTSLTASNPLASLTGIAELPTSFESLTADFEFTLPDVAPLGEIAAVEMKGQANIKGRIDGPLADPTLKGATRLEGLLVDGQPLGTLESDFDVETLASGPAGRLTSRLTHPDTTLNLATGFAVPNLEKLELTGLSLEAPGAAVEGALELPFDGGPITGQLQGEITDLNQLARLADQNAGGKLDFTARLDGKDGGQAAVIDIRSDGLNLDRDDDAAPALGSYQPK